ncbi:hypothetical protein PFISCL1PPCAC_17312, partial [Pristionchus fissidentatus]
SPTLFIQHTSCLREQIECARGRFFRKFLYSNGIHFCNDDLAKRAIFDESFIIDFSEGKLHASLHVCPDFSPVYYDKNLINATEKILQAIPRYDKLDMFSLTIKSEWLID